MDNKDAMKELIKTVEFDCLGVTVYPVNPWKGDYWRSDSKGDVTLDTGEYIADSPITAYFYSDWVGKDGHLLAFDMKGLSIFDATGPADEAIDEIEEEVGFEIDREEVGFAADALEQPGVAEKLAESYDLVKFTEIEPAGANAYKYLGPPIEGRVLAKYYTSRQGLDWDDLEEIADALLKGDKERLEDYEEKCSW